MSELLDQINTDTNKETISVKELTKALETGFFDKQENITTMIAELDTIDNTLERSCVQSLLKVAYQSPLYDKLQQYPEFINRLQIWSQHSYLEHMNVDEKEIGQIALRTIPKKPEDITLTTLSKYVNLKNILPEHHDMVLSVLQNQVKLFTQLCPDGKSLLDMKWNSKKNGLDAPVLKFSTISSLSDRIKKEAQVRKDYETIKNHNLKQIDPGKISKDCLKLWTITKLSTLPTELGKLDTQSAFAQFLQNNQNDVFYGSILQQYISIRLQPYLRKEGPVEYVSATIDKENPELIAYVRDTIFGKKYLGETASAYKNYKEQQQTLAKFHLTGATPDQIATFQRKRNNHQARVKPEYLKTIQEQEDKFNHESVLRHSQSTRDSMPYIKKGSVDKYIYNSVLTLTKDYVTLLLQTPEGKKLLKEKKYIDNPFMPGMRLNFAKGNIDSIVRDSFFEKFGDGIDDFKKAWKEGKREEVGRSIGSLVGGTVAAGATTILTGGSGVWAAGAAFTIGSRAGGSLGGMIGAGFEGKSWGEIGNAGLVGLGVGERDQNGKFINYFTDTKGNITQASLLHGTGRMGISLGTDYLSSVATFGLGNKIGLDKWAGKFVGAGWKQFASKGAVFGAEELFIENFLVDIPANTLQAGVSSYVLGNAIQDVGPRSTKLATNTTTQKQLDPSNPTNTQGDLKAALLAMKQTFTQNISPENLGQTFAATVAYGGMLEGGRGAINRVSVALPALSVKNINEISTAYQSHLSDLQTKFPTLSIGKDMSTLTLDGKLLDQTHPRFAELQGSLTTLQTLGASFTQEMEKISQLQQGLTDPTSPEAKKRGLIYGRKLLHPRMTPIEVLDSRIKKLQSEIVSTKKPDIKTQKEAVMKQMEEVKETLADKKTIISDVVMSESEVGGKIEGNKGQVEEVSVDDKKSEVYLEVGPIKVNKTILSEQHKELLYKIPGAKDIVLGSHILDLHRGETSDASVVKAGFKALQEKLLQAKNNGEEIPSYILGLSNLSFVLGKYGFSIFDSLPVEVYTQVGQYKRLFGEADPKNPLTPAELKQKERIGQYNNGKNPIKAAMIDTESFLKLDFGKEGEGKDLQQHELSNVNNLESINKALESLVHLIPTEILRRPNGSIGTQGFTEENFMSVAKYIAQEMGFTIPVYDKKSNVSEISQLINYLKNNKEAQQKIKEYVIKDPVIVSLLPDNTYHIEDGNHRANLLNLIGVDVIPTIERNGRDKQDVIDEHNAKVQTIENMYGQNPAVAKQSQDIGNSHIEGINNLTTHYPDLLKNIINPEVLSQIIQTEINAGNLVLNPDGSIKEVFVEVNGEKKPSQLFEKMKTDGFSEQQALKTWLQVRTPEFKKRFGDWQSADKSQVSKVVDENGEPLMVYHGSRTEIQDGIFKLPKDIEQTKTPMEGISTTTSKQVAIDYANKYHGGFEGGVVYPLFINIKNSISLDTVGEYGSYARYLRTSKGLSTKYNIHSYQELKEFENHMQENTNTYLSQDQVSSKGNNFIKDEFVELWASGFDLGRFVEKDNEFGGINTAGDGIIFNPHIDGNFSAATSVPYDQQLIFEPKNIKSAIDNDGSFSPETAKFNDYFGKESRFGFDSKQAREHSAFMDQFTKQATPEQIAQIREKIQAVAQIYTDKTGKVLELTDAQIQAIIATHLKTGELGKLTQTELRAKVAELATAIPDADMRRFLLEAGFCGMWGKMKDKISHIISRNNDKEEITHNTLSSFTDLGVYGGTNGGKRYMHKETGEKYFIKNYNNIDQGKSEYISNEFYKALGIPVVNSDILDGKYIANKEIKGTHEITNISDVKEGFVLDCILGNWDATIYGNLIQTEDNRVYRIDNGGSLFFRAQGGHKDSFANSIVDELNTLRNFAVNSTAAKYFSTITDNDIVQQIQKIKTTLTDSKIKEIVNKSNISNHQEIIDIIIKRRNRIYEKYASKNIDSLYNKIDEIKNKKYNSRLEFEKDFTLLDYSHDAMLSLFNDRITKDRIIEKIKSDNKINLLIEKGLTQEEALSVYRYTASGYKMVNNYNRDLFEKGIKALGSLETEYELTGNQLIETTILSYFIEQGLHKLPDISVEGIKELQSKYNDGEKTGLLFRNLGFSSTEEVAQFISKCTSDGELSDPGFFSTSILHKNFDTQGYKVALIIENGYNGKYIADYSHSWTELEVLFPPNTTFKIKGKPVKDKSGTWVVHLVGI